MWVTHCSTHPSSSRCIIMWTWLPTAIVSVDVVLLAPKNSSIFSLDARAFALCGWLLEMILNVTVTAGIAYHIWRTGRRTAALTSHFMYRSTIMMIVESGALVPICICTLFSLWAAGNIGGIVGINIEVQIEVSLQFPSVYKRDDWSRLKHRQWPPSSLSSVVVLDVPTPSLDHLRDTHHPTLGPWRSTPFVQKFQSVITQWMSYYPKARIQAWMALSSTGGVGEGCYSRGVQYQSMCMI